MYDNLKKTFDRIENPLIKQTVEYLVSRIEEAPDSETCDIAKSSLVLYVHSVAPDLLKSGLNIESALYKSDEDENEELEKHNTKGGRFYRGIKGYPIVHGKPRAPGDPLWPDNAPPEHEFPGTWTERRAIPSQGGHGSGVPGSREMISYLRDIQEIFPVAQGQDRVQRKDLAALSRTELKAELDRVLPGFYESGVVRGVGAERNTTQQERYRNMLDFINQGGKFGGGHSTEEWQRYLEDNITGADNRVPVGEQRKFPDTSGDGSPDVKVTNVPDHEGKKPAKSKGKGKKLKTETEAKPKPAKRGKKPLEGQQSLFDENNQPIEEPAAEASSATAPSADAKEAAALERRKKREEEKARKKRQKEIENAESANYHIADMRAKAELAQEMLRRRQAKLPAMTKREKKDFKDKVRAREIKKLEAERRKRQNRLAERTKPSESTQKPVGETRAKKREAARRELKDVTNVGETTSAESPGVPAVTPQSAPTTETPVLKPRKNATRKPKAEAKKPVKPIEEKPKESTPRLTPVGSSDTEKISNISQVQGTQLFSNFNNLSAEEQAFLSQKIAEKPQTYVNLNTLVNRILSGQMQIKRPEQAGEGRSPEPKAPEAPEVGTPKVEAPKKEKKSSTAEKKAMEDALGALKGIEDLVAGIDQCLDIKEGSTFVIHKAENPACDPEELRAKTAELKERRAVLASALEVLKDNQEIKDNLALIDQYLDKIPESLGGNAKSAVPEQTRETGSTGTPEKLPGEDYPPTLEQQDVIDAVAKGDTVVVRALAGTGKTSTLHMIARRNPNKKIIYLVFNKEAQLDAEKRFAGLSNVEIRTQSSVAGAALPSWYNQRAYNTGTQLTRAFDIANHLGIGAVNNNGNWLTRVQVVVAAKDAARRYAISSDKDLSIKHVPRRPRSQRKNDRTQDYSDAAREEILAAAKKIWADWTSESGRVASIGDVVMKQWALNEPDFKSGARTGIKFGAVDMVFSDEAQDINDVLADVLKKQNVQQVVVGDTNQAIYAFRGAKDQLDSWPSDTSKALQTTFRFGPAIADAGNRFLQLLNANLRIKAGPGLESKLNEISDPDAVLVRTNAGGFAEAMAQLANGKRVGYVGGKQALLNIAEDAKLLQNGKRAFKSQELSGFKDWDDVLEAKSSGELDGSVIPIINMVENHGPDEIRRVAEKLVDPKNKVAGKDYDVVISTAHKSKGLEWDKVKIGVDFFNPKKDPDTGEEKLPNAEELKLSYVAVTRAKKELDIGSLGWVYEKTSENGGAPAAKAPEIGSKAEEAARRRDEIRDSLNFGETVVAGPVGKSLSLQKRKRIDLEENTEIISSSKEPETWSDSIDLIMEYNDLMNMTDSNGGEVKKYDTNVIKKFKERFFGDV